MPIITGSLPDPGQIVTIEANLDGSFIGEASIDTFNVDRKFFERIVSSLSTKPVATIDSSNFGLPIAILTIRDHVGKKYKVKVPWAGKNVLVFTINGDWYSRNGALQARDPGTGEVLAFAADESILLYKALKEAYEDSKGITPSVPN